ncbi:hypothetical protein Csa_011859 [Cucumis sativus]|nr:hypothetical protein Csa_011859 [Cucumis sativus]
MDKGRPLPKFGEWDVNDPTSAEGFTVIFNKARDEKKTGGKPDSPGKVDAHGRNAPDPAKTPPNATCVPLGNWFCLLLASDSVIRNGFAVFKVPLLNLKKVRLEATVEKLHIIL